MLDFSIYPSYEQFRPLQLRSPYLEGFDVYALQLAIVRITGLAIAADGTLGPKTAQGIVTLQTKLGFTGANVDGIAGLATQRAAALEIGRGFRDQYDLPNGLLSGQMQFESSYRLGRYSAARTDGSYDAGVAQMNSQHTPTANGYDPVYALQHLAERVGHSFMLFAPRAGWPADKGVAVRGRRWMLAQGSWNAPAFASYLANEEGAAVPVNQTKRPSDASRAALEAYMLTASALTQQ
jgi:hypothetical protein